MTTATVVLLKTVLLGVQDQGWIFGLTKALYVTAGPRIRTWRGRSSSPARARLVCHRNQLTLAKFMYTI